MMSDMIAGRLAGCELCDGRPTRGAVLGIDPGLAVTGYAVLSAGPGMPEAILHEAGVIRLVRGQSLQSRLLHLEESLTALIRTHRPVCLVCEELYAHYRHPKTAILMGHARGVVLVAAARLGLPVVSVGATHVKKLLTGNGHASKRQMQSAVARMLGLSKLPEPPDVADAIAIAFCGLRQQGGLTGRRRRLRSSEVPT